MSEDEGRDEAKATYRIREWPNTCGYCGHDEVEGVCTPCCGNKAVMDKFKETSFALQSERRLRERMEAWHPIETAPKDGTYLLAFPSLMGVPLIIVWDIQHEYFRVALTSRAPPFKPTHWRPLPAPPAALSQQENH